MPPVLMAISSLISCKILIDVAETPSKTLRFRSFHKFQAVYIMTEARCCCKLPEIPNISRLHHSSPLSIVPPGAKLLVQTHTAGIDDLLIPTLEQITNKSDYKANSVQFSYRQSSIFRCTNSQAKQTMLPLGLCVPDGHHTEVAC
jgi:hypothetical protein